MIKYPMYLEVRDLLHLKVCYHWTFRMEEKKKKTFCRSFCARFSLPLAPLKHCKSALDEQIQTKIQRSYHFRYSFHLVIQILSHIFDFGNQLQDSCKILEMNFYFSPVACVNMFIFSVYVHHYQEVASTEDKLYLLLSWKGPFQLRNL